jgi:hypothetical protein
MRKSIFNLIFALMSGLAIIGLSACEGDSNEEVIPTAQNSFQYIDATKYTNWVYINLHQKDSVTLDYETTSVPISWDMAIHRYDVKTNGGSAMETSYEDLAKFQADVEAGTFNSPAASSFKTDVQDSIIVDLSQMMMGKIGYAASSVNTEMGKWLNLDLSTMPPIYTSSKKVYLLKMSDNTVAAIKFTGYTNPQKYNAKGYISFDYLYPINFSK